MVLSLPHYGLVSIFKLHISLNSTAVPNVTGYSTYVITIIKMATGQTARNQTVKPSALIVMQI